MNGLRDALGIRAGDGGEGTKYWLHVFTGRKNRGLDDVPVLDCDVLKGRPTRWGYSALRRNAAHQEARARSI